MEEPAHKVTSYEPVFISIVIPVLNEGKHICSVLESLLNQEYASDKFEILIVDGGSTDETVSVATGYGKAHSNVRVLENARRLSSSGRNIGARAARGDVVLFIDGHCEIPDEFLLRNLSDLFKRTSSDVICRPQPLEASKISSVQKAIAIARASWLGHNPHSLIFSSTREGFVNPESSGAAYMRHVFEQIGYYDERFDACEDVDFNLRARMAGLRGFTSSSVAINYYPRENIASLFRQMSRYGAGRARLFAKHRKEAISSALVLGAPIALVLVMAVLALFSKMAGLILLSLTGAYLLTTALTSAVLSIGSEFRLMPSIFMALVATHAGLFAGFLKGLMNSRGLFSRSA
jgi:succinoglycan biosynthesis protein ExoA